MISSMWLLGYSTLLNPLRCFVRVTQNGRSCVIMAGFPGGDYLETFGVVVMQSMGVRGSGIILHANNVIPVMLSLSECYVYLYIVTLQDLSS